MDKFINGVTQLNAENLNDYLVIQDTLSNCNVSDTTQRIRIFNISSSATNRPTSAGAGCLIHNGLVQFFIPSSGDAKLWRRIRTSTSGSWGSWAEIAGGTSGSHGIDVVKVTSFSGGTLNLTSVSI